MQTNFTVFLRRNTSHSCNSDTNAIERETERREYVRKEYISNCFSSLRCSCLPEGRARYRTQRILQALIECVHVYTFTHTYSEIETSQRIPVLHETTSDAMQT